MVPVTTIVVEVSVSENLKVGNFLKSSKTVLNNLST